MVNNSHTDSISQNTALQMIHLRSNVVVVAVETVTQQSSWGRVWTCADIHACVDSQHIVM